MDYASDDKVIRLDPVKDAMATMPASPHASGKLLGYRVHFGKFAQPFEGTVKAEEIGFADVYPEGRTSITENIG